MFVIRRENENGMKQYYKYFNSSSGRGIAGSKQKAAKFDEQQAAAVMRQLAALDNRGWEAVNDADGA